MDISLGAEVRCADGPCGHLIYVVLDPRKKIVVHVVVQSDTMPYKERLVPIDSILASTPRKILLRCTKEGNKDVTSSPRSKRGASRDLAPHGHEEPFTRRASPAPASV